MGESNTTISNVVQELSYSTIRLTCTQANGTVNVGTGFVMEFKRNKDNNTIIPVLVTNKHVVRGSVCVSFVLTEMVDGKPSSGRFPYTLPIPENAWRMHPEEEVDLCALAIGPILNALKDQGKYAKISCLPMEIIPKDEEIDNLFQLDEVVMIGYPNGIADEVNNQPIFRRGTLATKPSLDYNGRKEFLVDMAVYGGSSGSPVFVFREGVWYDRKRGSAVLMNCPAVGLIGIMQGVFTTRIDGRVVVKEIPTAFGAVVESSVPNNLGVAIKAERIKQLESLF